MIVKFDDKFKVILIGNYPPRRKKYCKNTFKIIYLIADTINTSYKSLYYAII